MLAVGVLRSDRAANPEDLLAGLGHPSVVREQAAFALYERTGRSLPADLLTLDEDERSWRKFLSARADALCELIEAVQNLKSLDIRRLDPSDLRKHCKAEATRGAAEELIGMLEALSGSGSDSGTLDFSIDPSDDSGNDLLD